jgi:hypothetical protein
MVALSLRRLQVQHGEGDAEPLQLEAHLRGAELGARELVVPGDRAGVGHQHQIAAAETVPIDVIDRQHEARVRVLVELRARDLGGRQALDPFQKVLAALHLVGVDEDRPQILGQPRCGQTRSGRS